MWGPSQYEILIIQLNYSNKNPSAQSLFTIFEKWFEISLSYWMCLLGTVCTCFRFEENSIVKGKRDFFLLKANYTMKNLLNSLRPFFKFAKFSFGAELQWSILKNLIQKMACSLRHQKLPMFFSFIRKNFFYRSFDEV